MPVPGDRAARRHDELCEQLRYDELVNCMRCGFCLPACPTFTLTGNDFDSPRGRIALARAVAESELPATDRGFAQAMEQCIGCLACQEVCPAGVRYDTILEAARIVTATGQRSKRAWLLDALFTHPTLLRLAAGALALYQHSGMRWLARHLGIVAMMGRLGEFEHVLPEVRLPGTRHLRPSVAYAPSDSASAWRARHAATAGALGNIRARAKQTMPIVGPPAAVAGAQPVRVAVFAGCIMDALMAPINEQTVRLLRRAGCEVIVPDGQGCCGALHAHNGAMETARALAKRTIAAFERANPEYIVSNAGGCGAQFFEYPDILRDEPEWQSRARAFVARVVDISEILLQLGTLDHLGPVRARVTFQDSCHLRNVMGVWREPRALLRAIPGSEFVELPDAASCCGSGGIYNLTEYPTAMRVLDRKMAQVRAVAPDVICIANPGCQLQLALGVRRAGLAHVRVMHIVELLNEALDAAPPA